MFYLTALRLYRQLLPEDFPKEDAQAVLAASPLGWWCSLLDGGS